MTREQAIEILYGMSLEDCIKMWNDSATDMYRRSAAIHEMEDSDWWSYLSNELGAYNLIQSILDSSSMEDFDKRDGYFLYDEDTDIFYSFNDKDKMIEIFGEWFIEEFINRE